MVKVYNNALGIEEGINEDLPDGSTHYDLLYRNDQEHYIITDEPRYGASDTYRVAVGNKEELKNFLRKHFDYVDCFKPQL